jgi:hypothetical protein
MENQLHLRITTEISPGTSPGTSTSTTNRSSPDWHLDDSTKVAGRSGIAQARAALEKARRNRSVDGSVTAEPATAPSIEPTPARPPGPLSKPSHRNHTTAA